MQYTRPQSPHRMLAASTGQHAGPKCMRTGVEEDQLGTRNCRLGAHSIRLVGDDCRWHHDLLFSIARLLDSLAE